MARVDCPSEGHFPLMISFLSRGVAAWVVFSVVYARAQGATTSDAGALGQRYIEAWGERTEPDDEIFFDRRKQGGVAFNLPVASALDVSVGGSFGKATGLPCRGFCWARSISRGAHAGE